MQWCSKVYGKHGRESRFPDRGRKPTSANSEKFPLPSVEKVDSPIGDENENSSTVKRLPDAVEKVDSPIGDENGSTNLSPSAFITYKKRRCSARGRKQYGVG